MSTFPTHGNNTVARFMNFVARKTDQNGTKRPPPTIIINTSLYHECAADTKSQLPLHNVYHVVHRVNAQCDKLAMVVDRTKLITLATVSVSRQVQNCEQSSRGKCPIFGDSRISFHCSLAKTRSIRFDRTSTCDGRTNEQTDGKRAIANVCASIQRRAGKNEQELEKYRSN